MSCIAHVWNKNDPLGAHVQYHVRHVTKGSVSRTHPLIACTHLVFLTGAVLVPHGPKCANVPFSERFLTQRRGTWHVPEFCELSAWCHSIVHFSMHSILENFQNLT